MKLNDPFGRMENRHQLGYESMRDAMRSSGVTTPEAAWKIVDDSKKRAQQYIAIGLVVLLLLSLLIPKAVPITLTLAILMVVFITNSTINGKRYIQRYIDEELEATEKNN